MGEGGGKVCVSESTTCKENSGISENKIKGRRVRARWGSDNKQGDVVRQLDVYTQTGKGSGYLNGIETSNTLDYMNWL